MAGTVATSDAVPVDDAIFLNQYGMSDLDSRLVRFRDPNYLMLLNHI